MSSRISLAQQIALLSQAAPTDIDPEDVQHIDLPSDNDAHEASTTTREHYVDVGRSVIRQSNHAILDTKYHGIQISRKQLLEDEKNLSDDLDVEAQSPRQSTITEPLNRDLNSTLRASREQDRRKGKAVARQIVLWNTLLDARIQLQKAVIKANHFPLDTDLLSLSQEATTKRSLDRMLDEAVALSTELIDLQEYLHRPNSARKRVKTSHHDSSDRPMKLISLSQSISDLEVANHPFLLQTLAKWSSKIQSVAPSALLPPNRSAFVNNVGGRNVAQNVVDLINDALQSGNRRSLGDSDIHKNSESRAQVDSRAETDRDHPNVFDDADFYQQILRDIIVSSGKADVSGGQDWVYRQKEKKAKRKHSIDTKASKGRKLRYEVHEKLQNFMVPISVSHGIWHEEQTDELFTSLFSNKVIA